MNDEELRLLVYSDLGGASTALLNNYTDCPDFDDRGMKTYNAASRGNFITRYYDDGEFVRAYCVLEYDGGVMILYDKSESSYRVILIGEDDGFWFPAEKWKFNNKSDFIACYSEALSIFNNNFSEEKK